MSNDVAGAGSYLHGVGHAPACDGRRTAHAVEHEEVRDRLVLARQGTEHVLREEAAEDGQCRREEMCGVLREVAGSQL